MKHLLIGSAIVISAVTIGVLAIYGIICIKAIKTVESMNPVNIMSIDKRGKK